MTRLLPALLPLATLLTLGGCGAGSVETAGARPPRVPIPQQGLGTITGSNAAALTRMFGQPDADLREGTARKLQFASAICVLDAYLYPPGEGQEPRVTWIDARQRDGSPIDRASCVAALTRRPAGK
jgi:hypothetical protein